MVLDLFKIRVLIFKDRPSGRNRNCNYFNYFTV